MTLQDRIAELAVHHGSLRALARATQIEVGYLSRLYSGKKVRPGKEILRKLGLRAVLTYESTEPTEARRPQDDEAYEALDQD